MTVGLSVSLSVFVGWGGVGVGGVGGGGGGEGGGGERKTANSQCD